MGKYEGLGQFLREQRNGEIPMTFADIERVTGAKLPPSALKHRPWWSNNPRNSVMTKVWLEAGFRTEQVDMEGRRLVFRRIRQPDRAGSEGSSQPRSGEENYHPLFGLMKDLMRITPGTDLTKPADPRWGDVWEKDS
jgi:hypothetical protein